MNPDNPYEPRPQSPHYVPNPGQQPVPPQSPQQQPGYQAYPPASQPVPNQANPYAQPQTYDFIMNPTPLPKRTFLSGSSLLVRVAMISGGLIVLIILVSIVKGLFSGSNNFQDFVSVAQDQQVLVSLATTATSGDSGDTSAKPVLTTNHQNFAWSTRLALASSQRDTLVYLQKNGQKVDQKELSLKLNAATNKQLADAASASTYDSTFEEIMKTKLTNYMRNLQVSYTNTKGPNGKLLLSKQYDQAELLKRQLESKAQ